MISDIGFKGPIALLPTCFVVNFLLSFYSFKSESRDCFLQIQLETIKPLILTGHPKVLLGKTIFAFVICVKTVGFTLRRAFIHLVNFASRLSKILVLKINLFYILRSENPYRPVRWSFPDLIPSAPRGRGRFQSQTSCFSAQLCATFSKFESTRPKFGST